MYKKFILNKKAFLAEFHSMPGLMCFWEIAIWPLDLITLLYNGKVIVEYLEYQCIFYFVGISHFLYFGFVLCPTCEEVRHSISIFLFLLILIIYTVPTNIWPNANKMSKKAKYNTIL